MATAAPPWDSWTLDEKFLADLDGWIKVHPDDKLGTVLDTVCKAIDSGKDLINLIPDSPFPARSLIQELGALVQLGNACCLSIIYSQDLILRLNTRLFERLSQLP